MTIAYSSPVWKMIDTMRLAGYDVMLKFDRIGYGRTGFVSCSVYVQDDTGIQNEFIEKIRETIFGAVTDAYSAWRKELRRPEPKPVISTNTVRKV